MTERPELAAPSPAYPFTAVALIVAAAFPVRFKVGFSVFGSITLLDIAVAGSAMRLIMGALTRNGRLKVGDPRVTTLLLVPFLACVFSLMWSDDLNATFRAVGIFSEAIAAYFVVLNAFGGLSTGQLFRYLSLLVVLLLLGSCLSLLQVPGFGPPPRDLVPGSPELVAYLAAYYARLGNPFYGLSNDFASVLALYVLPLLVWGVVSGRIRYSLFGGLAFTGVVMTLSRGVILSTTLGVLFFLYLERRRVLKWLPAILLGLGFVLTIGYAYYELNEAVQSYVIDRLNVGTIEVRGEILNTALTRIAEAPVLGYGGGVVSDPILVDGAHNTYLQQALYYGIPLGILCSVALVLVAVRFLRWPGGQRLRFVAMAIAATVIIQLGLFLGETSFEATLPKTAFYMFIAFATVVLATLRQDDSLLVGDPSRP